jgi:putative lipoprotein
MNGKESPMRELVPVSLLIAATMLLGCQSSRGWKASSQAKITGTVTYLQKSALPHDAVVQLRLEDVSRADAQANVIAEERVETRGQQVPIPFELSYDAARIQSSHRYALHASILVGGTKAFTSARAFPVITQGAPTQLAILVEPIGSNSRGDAAASASPPLLGTYWRVVEVAGEPAASSEGHRVAHLILRSQDKRIEGSGGVNLLSGSYALQGSTLRFGDVLSTLMAGPPTLMNQEKKFCDALGATTGYRINGKSLELLDGERVLARLEATEPP